MIFEHLKKPVHGTTNYRSLVPFLDEADRHPDHATHFTAGEYMDLVVENLHCDFDGRPVYSISHYGEQNGDLMADPDMTICVDRSSGIVEPLTYQNDYMSIFQEIYTAGDHGQPQYKKKLRSELDRFLWQWLQNIKDQGFTPASRRLRDDESESEPAAQPEASAQPDHESDLLDIAAEVVTGDLTRWQGLSEDDAAAVRSLIRNGVSVPAKGE